MLYHSHIRIIMKKDSGNMFSSNLVLLFSSSFAFMASFYMLLPVLPLYILHIGGNKSQVGLIIGAFAFSALIFRLVVGWANDIFGRKPFVSAGALIFTLSSFLYMVAVNVASLIGLRIFHGVGMAAFQTSALTMVVDSVPEKRRGEAVGLFGISANIAMASAPALGAILASGNSYSLVFTVSGIVALISAALSFPLKEPARQRSCDPSCPKPGFFCIEALPASISIFALMLSYGATLTYAPLLLVHKMSAQTGKTAIFFTVYAIALITLRQPAGVISDRISRLAAILPGMTLAGSAMLLLAFGHTITIALVGAAIYGIGMALAQPALTAASIDRVEDYRRGSAMGTFTFAFELGISLGALGSGLLVGVSGYSGAFYAAGVVVIFTGLAYFFIRNFGSSKKNDHQHNAQKADV